MAGQIHSSLDDMVRSNRVIVRQLKEVISKGNQCSCACHSKPQNSDDDNKLQKVEERLDEVDILIKEFLDKQKENEAEIEKLKLLNNELEQKLKEFREFLSKADDLNKNSNFHNETSGGLTSAASASSDKSDTERVSDTVKPKEEMCKTSEVEEGSDQSKYTNAEITQTESGAIYKPNFTQKTKNKPHDSDKKMSVKKKATSPNVEVIRQTDVKLILEMDWRWKARLESERDLLGELRLPLIKIRCVATVICLDVSASMAENNAWEHAGQFVMEYLDGLEQMKVDHRCTDESVALVTFGLKTDVVQRLTNTYNIIKQTFLGLKIGGPTPMFGGLMLTVTPFNSKAMVGNVGGIYLYDKIVLITDGNPTETGKIAGPDTISELEREKATTSILNICENIKKESIDLYCVPCGNANMEFLSKLVTASDGKMIDHTDGKWLSKRFYVTMEAARHQFDLFPGVGTDWCHDKFNKKEQEEMTEIIERCRRKHQTQLSMKNMEMYRDTDNPNLPPVGSRVRRGPDWTRGNFDGNEPGTVIGHSSGDGCIWVHWDVELQNIEHRYGLEGRYEVLIVDEPKILDETFIMGVGCEVTPGPQWKKFNTQVVEGMKGIAIKLDQLNGFVQVKWENGERGAYSYFRGQQEVILTNRLRETRSLEIIPNPVVKPKNKNLKTSKR